MYQRNSRRCCALMLTVSVCLRLFMLLGLDAKVAAALSGAAKDPEFARWMLFLETGSATEVTVTNQEPELLVLRMLEPQPVTPEPIPVDMEVVRTEEPDDPIPIASAGEISVSGNCTYQFDKEALLARPSAITTSGSDPQILIVHTHGSEAYTMEAGWEYQSTASFRTLNPERSVIAVGDALAESLEQRGISVIHDRTIHDYPSFNNAYPTTLETIESWLTQYPGIQMVIDLHRDAVEDPAGNALALSSTQNGSKAAQLMLEVGTDQGGLSHPNWQENLANALKLQAVLQGQWPGLCRSIDLRTERFNQHATPGSLIVEVGTNGNTLQQAVYSAQLLGESLAAMLTSLAENDGVLAG